MEMENWHSATTGSQTTPLVSAPATRPLSSHRESVGTVEVQTAAFTLPTSQQLAAIHELRETSEERVLAWLALVRSLEHGFQYRGAAGGLSYPQVNAISTLRDCSDSNIVTWLQYVALSGNVNLRDGFSRSTLRSSTSPSQWRTRRSSAKSTLRSSISSLAPSIYSSGTAYSTPRSSIGYPSSLPGLPEVVSENERLGHTHRCHECGKNVDSCDGWKRHMKEHETYFPCMPSGPVEYNKDVPLCALCGSQNPDREHLAEHRITLCLNGSKHPTRKSRKSLLVTHLALHGVFDPAASNLADKWQYKRNKQAFACGFCINYFPTIMEQLNHIDNEHYKNGEDDLFWDINVVIKGLLHQPKVYKYWQRLLASDPRLEEVDFSWDTNYAETLQTQLEIGDDSGGDLALTAFGSRSGTGMSSAVTIPVLQHMAIDPFIAARGSQSDCAKASVNDPLQPSSSAIHQKIPESQLGKPSRTDPYRSQTASPSAHLFSSASLPTDHHSFLNPDELGYGCLAQEAPDLGTDNDFSHFRTQWDSNLNDTQIPVGDTPPDQHSRLQQHLIESGALLAAQVSYFDRIAVREYADFNPSSQAIADFSHSRSDSASGPSTDLPNYGLVKQNSSPRSWEKPLPALPDSAEKNSAEPWLKSPKSPMDIDIG